MFFSNVKVELSLLRFSPNQLGFKLVYEELLRENSGWT